MTTPRLDDALWLIDSGESPAQIAVRLGVRPNAIGMLLTRHGYPELARPFWRLNAVRPQGQCATCGAATSRGARRRCRSCATRARWTSGDLSERRVA